MSTRAALSVLAALGGAVLLAVGCTPSYPIDRASPPPAVAPSPTPPPRAPPAPAPAPPRSPIPSAPSGRDQCGAAELQRLVGRPRSEIPVPVEPGRQRVACVGCPITLDFNAQRLNFFFDAETGIIREVKCG
jgi:hypothetical protein